MRSEKLKWRDRLFLWTIVVALAAPKTPLLAAGGSAIRPEDLLILMCGLLALTARAGLRVTRQEGAFLAWVAALGISTSVAALVGRVSLIDGLLFSVRPLEYWLVARMVLTSRLDSQRFVRPLALIAYLSGFLAAFQTAGLGPNFGVFDTTRGSGFTNGPYELAALAAGLFFFLRANGRRGASLAALLALVLSAARITLVGTLIVILFEAVARNGRATDVARRVLTAGAVLMLAGALAAGLGPLSVARNRFDADALSAARYGWQVAERADVKDDHDEFVDFAYGPSTLGAIRARDSDLDASAAIRFMRWATLFLATVSSLSTTLLGLGPSFAGVAVDGFYVRAFVEGGVIGLLLMARWLTRTANRARGAFRSYVFALLFTALFIDVLVSYKPMVLFWLLFALEKKTAVQGPRLPASAPLVQRVSSV